MNDGVGRVTEELNLIVAGGEAKRESLGPIGALVIGDCARTGWLDGGGVMLVERGAGDPSEDLCRLVVEVGLSGGGVEGTFISEDGSVLALAIVAFLNESQVIV